MDISIVIPNYNGEKLLEKNLPKLLQVSKNYSDGKTEIIVVDDASTDKSIGVLKKHDVEVLEIPKNLGFSSTVNKGVDKAKGEIVILLNTDVSPETDFLEPLLKHFKEDPNVFAVGCMDKSIENGKTILRGRGLGKWEKGFLVHRRGEIDKTNTLWVSGGSGAFRKSIWIKLGGLNEIYNPFYWEDIDLSYRALKSGFKVLFEPKSIVIHEHAIGAIAEKYSEKEIKKIVYRNQFIFSFENATDYKTQFEIFLFLPFHIIKAVFRKDMPFFQGFFSALVLLPKVIKSSLHYQKMFVKKDKEVMAEFG
jgi:GT2 family glycosyltransferase